jgi:hypothetical protein
MRRTGKEVNNDDGGDGDWSRRWTMRRVLTLY